MRYLALIIAVMLVIPTFGQRKKKEDEGIAPAYVEGIAYALPRTGIKVHVEAIREKFEPGPYAAYAQQLLGIKDARNRASVKWMVSAVKIETFSEPDPQQVYKAMGDIAATISLAPNGCLAGINSAGTATMSLQVQSNKTFQKPDLDDGFSFDYFSDTPFLIPGDSTNNFRPTAVGMEQKAAEAAQRVLDCRMNQYDLAALRIDGEYPDGKAYEVSLAELKRTEQNYIKLFVGRTTYKTETFSFDYMPEANEKNAVIFRISDENGVVPASDLSGKPVMVEFEQVAGLLAKYQAEAASDNPDAGYDGVYYRMPGVANIKVIYELNSLASARATIAQFGSIAPVPEELLGGDYSIEFHPETGAIKSVQLK
ncbi:DUF4831 family protein [Draconibacterium sediminis]|uniref:DUF4831 domain-containing protein n=1 Tax=Draconibacterium sediminis TaxID=1544798 RepID=A0A0D8J6G2_9BACT|nr:DUF4831 family protein [Draconibacterium sediminis]KJF42487.1 hypothetical protein LH29_18205 [Draconibacterium sediminis]